MSTILYLVDSKKENLKLIQDALHCCLPTLYSWSKKLASFGSAAAAPAAGNAAGASAEAAKVEEKVVEEEEEVDMGGGMDMFGGDEDY
ncbi:Ribosomal protein L10/L12 [Plasmopara halstedii]|uniref:Ribosomal protein L10/L12 n=1 Tax=Plasmopara halstedii TaxID=4781 RepID=A0A0P1A9A3_PLAHL|nr:Ribosomal protein L10/L12 [Plasmopara halstedii]CEG37338.1 Ribosomal protein L10/L12 [Plasmopara halstedii]|eukprot:XP_024573707.1 Ribosomal protein L10/L12 [Plasmopara halstedii]